MGDLFLRTFLVCPLGFFRFFKKNFQTWWVSSLLELDLGAQRPDLGALRQDLGALGVDLGALGVDLGALGSFRDVFRFSVGFFGKF